MAAPRTAATDHPSAPEVPSAHSTATCHFFISLLILGGKPCTFVWGYPRTSYWLQGRGSDELTILVEAQPAHPERLRRLVQAIEPSWRVQPDSLYKRASNDQSASVVFYLMDRLAQEADAAIRGTLQEIFAQQSEV
jgi:hypothetical protein